MYDDITVIISSATAVVAGIGLIYTGLSHRSETRSNYYQILKDLDLEVRQIESHAGRLSYEDDVREYINFYEKISFLFYNKIIPYEIISYFDDGFSYALEHLQESRDRDNMSVYQNFRRYCNEYKIKMPKD